MLGFSGPITMVTQMIIGYCDVCIHIYHISAVHDFHLFAILEHDCHTGKVTFNMSANAMDAVYLDQHETTVEAWSPSKKKMTGQTHGVITWIQRVANPGIMSVGYGAQQHDSCIQSIYIKFF